MNYLRNRLKKTMFLSLIVGFSGTICPVGGPSESAVTAVAAAALGVAGFKVGHDVGMAILPSHQDAQVTQADQNSQTGTDTDSDTSMPSLEEERANTPSSSISSSIDSRIEETKDAIRWSDSPSMPLDIKPDINSDNISTATLRLASQEQLERIFGQQYVAPQEQKVITDQSRQALDKLLALCGTTIHDNTDDYVKISNFLRIESPDNFRANNQTINNQTINNQTINNQTMLFILVHGTCAHNSDNYNSVGGDVFVKTIAMAYRYAQERNCPVEIMSLRWSGLNTDQARIKAGQGLADIINGYITRNPRTIFTIAHSHGGNVVNYATNRLSGNASIDTIINIATPVVVLNSGIYSAYKKAFKTLLNLYSTEDVVQPTGSSLREIVMDFLTGSRKVTPLYNKNRPVRTYATPYNIIIDARVRIDGNQGVSHTDMPGWVVPYLYTILQQRERDYVGGIINYSSNNTRRIDLFDMTVAIINDNTKRAIRDAETGEPIGPCILALRKPDFSNYIYENQRYTQNSYYSRQSGLYDDRARENFYTLYQEDIDLKYSVGMRVAGTAGNAVSNAVNNFISACASVGRVAYNSVAGSEQPHGDGKPGPSGV